MPPICFLHACLSRSGDTGKGSKDRRIQGYSNPLIWDRSKLYNKEIELQKIVRNELAQEQKVYSFYHLYQQPRLPAPSEMGAKRSRGSRVKVLRC